MLSTCIVTFTGPDRPGLVEALASVVAANGGNWQESRLAQMAGHFAGIVQLQVPNERAPTLKQALLALNDASLSVQVEDAGAPSASIANELFELSLIGPDRPGIIHEVSQALARRQLNVRELNSGVSSAPMTGEALFNASALIEVGEGHDIDELHDTLGALADLLALDIRFQRASR